MSTSVGHTSRSPSPQPQSIHPCSPNSQPTQPSRAEPLDLPCVHVEVAPTPMSSAEALDTFCGCTGRHVIASAMQRFKAEEQGLSRVDATCSQLHREQNAFASNVQSRLTRAATVIHRARAEWRAANGPLSHEGIPASIPSSRTLSRPHTKQRSTSPTRQQTAHPQSQDKQQLDTQDNQISTFTNVGRPALQNISADEREQQDRDMLKRSRDQNNQKSKRKKRSKISSRDEREVE